MFKLGITAVTFAPSVLVGQSERLVTPTAHTVESPAEFTRVTAVFELPGGKVVVVDQGEAIIGMVDFASGTKSNVGRHGSGPGEYRLPTLMYPLGGDSVGILDDGNGRLLVIGSDGKTGGFATPRAEWGLAALTGDGRGYLYAEGSASRRSPGGALVISDSAPLVRWRLGGNVVDTVAFLVRPMPAGAIATASGAVTRPGTVTALQPRQAWAVSRAGTTAVVSHDPYQVSLVRSSGDVVRGPTIPYEKAPITDSVKRAFVADVTEPTASVVVDEHGKVQISRGRAPFTRIPSA